VAAPPTRPPATTARPRRSTRSARSRRRADDAAGSDKGT
jgi:hypothetical protein